MLVTGFTCIIQSSSVGLFARRKDVGCLFKGVCVDCRLLRVTLWCWARMGSGTISLMSRYIRI